MEHELETPEGGRTDDVQDEMIVRAFEAEMSAGDGRTVDVRIVPYGETATSIDGFGGVPKGVPYQEQWMPGAFAQQVRAANRVLVNVEHQPGLAGIVGHGVALRDAHDGLYGSFKMHENADGDKALMLVREQVLTGVSLEVPVRTVKSVRAASGVIQRVKGHLQNIAFCRRGAYASALVLAVRTAPILDEEILPLDMDPELVERCRRLGIALPQRYQTHPAEADTPAEAGTSEAAPVEDTTTPTLEET